MESVIRGGEYEIRVDRPVETHWSMGHHEIADGWFYVDANGHRHTSLDTLEWAVTGVYWCETCSDEHEEGEYRCKVCGDVVEPRWVFTGPESFQVAGLATVTVRFADGRWWLLRADETTIRAGETQDQWVARVTAAREPDGTDIVIRHSGSM